MGNEINYQELIDRITDRDTERVEEVGGDKNAKGADTRRVIEQIWEEKRLQREISELDFDFDDLDEAE